MRPAANLKLEVPMGETKVLLHSCCAPCSSAIIEAMVNCGITPTVFFSNSNITPSAEYELRRHECERYVRSFGLEIIDDQYDHNDWLRISRGLEDAPERGPRCLECFRYRLTRAARYAAEHGFRVLTTTLASSRWKSLDQVNEAGLAACGTVNATLGDGAEPVIWWEMNWRKGGLQERRNEIIREQRFYNQLFCGCEFSSGK
ncbi:MAG: epoxyqueuosine reductase QueH [Bacteroidales bacterium]|nr:epoxyqueuosine reductase QueH [Bacteroidales bacterium]